MWAKPDDLSQHTERLLRVVEPPLFRFVIIQGEPQQYVASIVENILRENFPERPLQRIEIQQQDYSTLLAEIEGVTSGFAFLENFDILTANPDLFAGFNQRRDRLASRPVALIAFLTSGINALRRVQDHLPDFWSFRALTLELKCRFVPELHYVYEPEFREPMFDLTFKQKNTEIARIRQRITQLPDDDAIIQARLNIELAEYFSDLFQWPKGLEAIETIFQVLQSLPHDKETIALKNRAFLLKATLLKDQERSAEADNTLTAALEQAESQEDKEQTVRVLNLRGAVLLKAGEIAEAKNIFEQSLTISENHLPPLHAGRIESKAYLGIAWRKIGDYDKARKLLEEAFYENAVFYKKDNYRGQVILWHTLIPEQWKVFGMKGLPEPSQEEISKHHPFALLCSITREMYHILEQTMEVEGAGRHPLLDKSLRIDDTEQRLINEYGDECPLLAFVYIAKARTSWKQKSGRYYSSQGQIQHVLPIRQAEQIKKVTEYLDLAEKIIAKAYPNNKQLMVYLKYLRWERFSLDKEKSEGLLREIISEIQDQKINHLAILTHCKFALGDILRLNLRFKESWKYYSEGYLTAIELRDINLWQSYESRIDILKNWHKKPAYQKKLLLWIGHKNPGLAAQMERIFTDFKDSVLRPA